MLDVQNDELPFITGRSKDDFKGALLQNGDIIIADTAEDETTGKVCEIVNIQDKDVVAGLHTMVCRPKNKTAEGYFGYYMNSSSYHHQLLPLMQGIKVLSLSKTNVQKTTVKYPKDKAEQQKIADCLRRIDTLITLHQRKLEKLVQIRKAFAERCFLQSRKEFVMAFTKEADFEEAVVKLLIERGWKDGVLKNYTEQQLIQNWANILFENNRGIDRLNDYPLTDGEMQQIMEQVMNAKTPMKLNKFINGKSVLIKRDNPDDKLNFGKEVSLKIYDRLEIAAGLSRYQIAEQPKFPTKSKILNDRRGDLMLLINGMPVIHMELKKSGVSIKRACNLCQSRPGRTIQPQLLFPLGGLLQRADERLEGRYNGTFVYPNGAYVGGLLYRCRWFRWHFEGDAQLSVLRCQQNFGCRFQGEMGE